MIKDCRRSIRGKCVSLRAERAVGIAYILEFDLSCNSWVVRDTKLFKINVSTCEIAGNKRRLVLLEISWFSTMDSRNKSELVLCFVGHELWMLSVEAVVFIAFHQRFSLTALQKRRNIPRGGDLTWPLQIAPSERQSRVKPLPQPSCYEADLRRILLGGAVS